MDFEADAEPKLNLDPEKLKNISKLAMTQLVLEQEIEKTESKLAEYKKNHKWISESKIPEAMNEVGMSSFGLSNGAGVQVKPFYDAKIDDSNREVCFKWLIENGHGALIGKDLVLSFGNVDLDWEKLIPFITKCIHEFDEELKVETSVTQGVHHATLKAFVKEQVTAGKEFPLAMFKGYVGNKTKIIIN